MVIGAVIVAVVSLDVDDILETFTVEEGGYTSVGEVEEEWGIFVLKVGILVIGDEGGIVVVLSLVGMRDLIESDENDDWGDVVVRCWDEVAPETVVVPVVFMLDNVEGATVILPNVDETLKVEIWAEVSFRGVEVAYGVVAVTTDEDEGAAVIVVVVVEPSSFDPEM